ncbi:carboxyltransferase domain-containing protein, partial [Acinetobacter sp. WU_MDCI_Abxc22]
QQLDLIENFSTAVPDVAPISKEEMGTTILAQREAMQLSPKTVYRQAGDSYILLEYGDNILDLSLRLRVHKLIELIRAHSIAGILELSPGVRSLQIKYDGLIIPQKTLIAELLYLEEKMGDLSQIKIPSRMIYLPMAFEDSATLSAVERYQESVCAKAPWLPNNVDF